MTTPEPPLLRFVESESVPPNTFVVGNFSEFARAAHEDRPVNPRAFAVVKPEPCTCRPVLVARFVREALVGLEYRHQRARGCDRPSEPVDVKTWRKSW